MIRLSGVAKQYPSTRRPAVTRLDLDVDAGELVVLVGPSGCGKSTTLKMINRLVDPTSGVVEVAGRDVRRVPRPELRRGIGYVIQHGGLLPHHTVAQNIATVPRLLGWASQRIDERTSELLELMGLEAELADRYPNQLSGGQMQRVGVARALAADPPVLLMDEPFGAVDPVDRLRLQGELLRLQDAVRKTIVFVTHDIDEAVRLGDRVAIYAPDGTIARYDTPDAILADPGDPFVRTFLGKERGLRRLALRRVGDLPLSRGPVVGRDQSAKEALAAMDACGVDWVALVDGTAPLGWLSRADVAVLNGGLVTVRPHAFPRQLALSDSLRHALDALLESDLRAAPVVTDGALIGVVSLDELGGALG